MKGVSGIFLVLLGCLLDGSTAHKETNTLRDVNCNFIQDDRGYVCELENLKLIQEDDQLRFTGTQLGQNTNEDVTCLHIKSSSQVHIVPSENIFNFFTNLVKLVMKKVGVQKVDPIINCYPLELIDLSENQITSLDAGVFIECEALEILDLSSNEIVKIHENSLSSLGALQELDLSHNKIGRISRKTIKPMKNLRKLSLQSNSIKELAHDTFNDMFHMTELDLSDNPLARLDFRSFDFTIHVETLRLKGLKINKFHQFTFKNLRRLRNLDISDNIIRHVENELMSTNAELIELRMDNCGIQTIGRQFFDRLNKLNLFAANNNKCVDGVFRGQVISIRPNFLKCMDNFDVRQAKGGHSGHSGEEL